MENKRWEKAFLADLEDRVLTLMAAGSRSSSSSSSSSDEEMIVKKGGKKDAGGPVELCFMAKGHKRRSRRGTKSSNGFCTMALDGKTVHEGSSSDDDTDPEVSVIEEEIL